MDAHGGDGPTISAREICVGQVEGWTRGNSWPGPANDQRQSWSSVDQAAHIPQKRRDS